MASAVVSALLALLVGYGILTEARATLWSALALAVLPLAQGWVTRSLVVPLSRLRGKGRAVHVRVTPDGDWTKLSRDEVCERVHDTVARRRRS